MLNDLLSCWRPTADFCRRLSYELGRPVGCSAFFTPVGGQGFGRHYDMYSSFVVQLSGHKTWQLFRPAWNLPLELLEQSWQNGTTLSKADRHRILRDDPDMTVDLAAGDVLWLPRGWIHNPFSTCERSLHLTIHMYGLTEYKMLDTFRAMLRVDESFRGSLPLDFPWSPGVAKSATADFLAHLSAKIAEADPAEFAEAVQNWIRASWYPPRCHPFTGAFLTEEELGGYDGLVTTREAVLSARRRPGGDLAIDVGQQEVIVDAAAADLIVGALAADDGQLIPLDRIREALGDKSLAVIGELIGAGVATLAKAG